MYFQYSNIVVVSFATSGIALFTAWITWRRRSIPGGLATSFLMLAIAEWTFARAFEAIFVEMPLKVIWAKIEYLGILSVPVLWLIFVSQYSRKDAWLIRRNMLLLWIIPVITLALVATNEWHGLIWSYIIPSPGRETELLIYKHGTWFWIQMAYSYLLMFVGTFKLAQVTLSKYRLYKLQSMSIFTAAAIPWIGNAIYLSGNSPIPGLDLTPFAFTVTGLVLCWSIFRHRLFDLVPVARDSLIENMDDGVIVLDAQNRIVDINPAARRMLGKTDVSLVGKKADEVLDQLSDVILNESKGLKIPTEIMLSGENLPNFVDLKISHLLFHDRYGHFTGCLISFRDITDRKKTETALRESEEKYRTILESIEDGYYEVDLAGNFTFFNDSICKFLGYSKDELMGMNNREYMSEENAKKLFKVFNSVFKTGKASKGYEWEVIGKDGSRCYVEASVSLRRDSDNQPIGFQGIVRDISERRKAEEEKTKLEAQFLQAQKMEAIGTLAGGIAHDFNNLLMSIQGRASLILMKTDASHPHLQHLKGMEADIRSASGLTRQLLGFARGGKYEVKPTNLNNVINNSSEMFGRTKKEITIHQKVQKDIWTVEVDQTQIEQVLLNLYVNAWQAMSGTGELSLETKNVTLDESFVKPYGVKPGNYVKISVGDTGIGVDRAIQQRIFDPFFTTKEKSRGTGLGLASAYGIIRSHGGIINVYSEKGKGATFNIYLPTSEKEVKKGREISEDVIKGTETLLLIDDEEMIIEVGQEMLENLGYTVLSAKSGKEAIATFQKKRERIDGVILDMIMPQMSGSETYDRLKEIDPDIKVLLSSGYSINGLAKTILAKGCDGFIQKPFSLIDLSQKLRGILDEE